MTQPAETTVSESKRCPLCDSFLLEPEVRNSLSRYVSHHICNQCGMGEALLGLRVRGENRTCLYYDEVMGIAMVEEDKPGYYAWAPHPSENQAWIKAYVESVNERHGHSAQDVSDIVVSSFAASGM